MNSSAMQSSELNDVFELVRPYLIAIARRDLPPYSILGLTESDMVQEALLAAHAHWTQYRGSSFEDLLRWLRAILRHQIYHHRRKNREITNCECDLELAHTSDAEAPEMQLEKEDDSLQ